MILPTDIDIYGDRNYRGKCPLEMAEQITFFSRIRRDFPDSYGAIAIHIKNEGKRRNANFEKIEGMVTGASDIVIPGSPTFVCELKRQDHTQSSIGDDQLTYLRTAQSLGAFTCIALGRNGAWEAFNEWRSKA